MRSTLQTSALINLAQAKDYDSILTTYQTYSISTIVETAEFLRHQDIYNVALPLYDYLLQQQPTADTYFGIGQCYGKAYQYQTALFYLQQAFQQGDRTEGADYYAYILERNLLMDQAEQWYQIALKNGYADDLWTLSHYAYFLEKDNQLDAAERVYQSVLQQNPAYTWAVKRYALLLLKQHQVDRSLELMQRSLEQFPNNPFVKLNYLEYLIIRGDVPTYEAYASSLNNPQLVLPFQTLIALFEYFQHYLLQGQSNPEKLAAYQAKAQGLKDSIHRDFDDLNALLVASNGDLATWRQMTQWLVK
ncbi:tetratricopeptide repeat protein [Stenomitos frigidus]|nr:tetratricopeptide repeat protein [Stenomitos frigidus]